MTVAVCLAFSFSLCAMGPAAGPPVLGCRTVPRWSMLESHNELPKGDRGREPWKEDRCVGGHRHSPRAQKTLSLLESGKDTFKTSLWLSKSSSGPPQLSTIGDISCRSGRVACETNVPNQDPLFPSLLTSHPCHHSPSSDLRWLACRSSLDPWTASLSQFTNRMAPEPPEPQRQVFCGTREGLG